MTERAKPQPGSRWVHRREGYEVVVDGVNAHGTVRCTEQGMLIVHDHKLAAFHRAYKALS